MLSPRESIERWVRDGSDPVAATIRRAATSAVGTYGAYVGYGLAHAALREPHKGPEAHERLPGDDLIPAPESTKTFVVDIAVPPSAVWPYLVQMGYGRAGWYGWYPLENGGRGAAPAILEECQGLAIGDAIPDGPLAAEGFGIWRVVELDPPNTLVLFSRREALTGRELAVGDPVEAPAIACSWVFVVRPEGDGSRLIVRVRVRFLGVDDGVLGRLTRRFFDVGDTVMEWTMLEGIKARAERIAVMPSIDRSFAEVRIPVGEDDEVFGSLTIPEDPRRIVIFAHDSSSRHRLRNLRVAWALQARGMATLVLDLHAVGQDAAALARRLVAATDWTSGVEALAGLPLGYVAAGAGAAAALLAASQRPERVGAVVTFCGDFDGAGRGVRAPTLLVVGADDEAAVASSRAALEGLPTTSKLVSLPGAAHLFEEPGVLAQVSSLAIDWLDQ